MEEKSEEEKKCKGRRIESVEDGWRGRRECVGEKGAGT